MNVLTLVRNEDAGTDLRLLTFAESLDGFVHPGQFVVAHPEGMDKAFFALASCPGEPTQLLIKQSGATAEYLCGLASGATVPVSDPMGKGFPIPADDTRPLVILATGSGISAVRSVIEAEIASGLKREVHFLYGVFTVEHCSFTDRLAAWTDAGVKVHIVLSDPPEAWSGPTGFVQQAAVELGMVRSDVVVVLCGFPGMIEQAKALYTEAGASADDLLTNF